MNIAPFTPGPVAKVGLMCKVSCLSKSKSRGRGAREVWKVADATTQLKMHLARFGVEAGFRELGLCWVCSRSQGLSGRKRDPRGSGIKCDIPKCPRDSRQL